MSKLAQIANRRERLFAEVFFDHDDWEHHPPAIYFKGGKYTADFYDRRRETYIEVVGTRQAFAANRYKYLYLLEIRNDITLEFRSHEGKLLDPYRMSLATGHDYGVDKDLLFFKQGLVPPGKVPTTGMKEKFNQIFLATNITRSEMAKISGISQDIIYLITSAPRPVLFIKEHWKKQITDFFSLWDSHPELIPGRIGPLVGYIRTIFPHPITPNMTYTPAHPANTLVVFEQSKRGKSRPATTPLPPEQPHADS